MKTNLSDQNKIIFYSIAGAMLLYFGLSTLICYDAGKHDFSTIDWLFVIQGALPVMIISASLFYQAFRIKKQLQ